MLICYVSILCFYFKAKHFSIPIQIYTFFGSFDVENLKSFADTDVFNFHLCRKEL